MRSFQRTIRKFGGPAGLVCVLSAWAPNVHAQAGTFPVSVTLPTGVNVRQVLLGSSNSLTVESNATLLGATRPVLVSMGTGATTVRSGPSNADLYSVGPVTLDGAKLTGKVRGEKAVSLINGATVAGGVVQNTSIGRQAVPTFQVKLPATDAGSSDIGNAVTVTLPPGDYHDVAVRSGGTLKLSSGHYTMNTFIAESSSKVIVDDTVDVIQIDIRNSLTHRGTFLPASGSPSRTLLVYVGTATAFIDAAIDASIIAPNALLVLGSAPNTSHRGAYFAKDIQIRSSATVRLIPSDALNPVVTLVTPASGTPVPGYDPGSLGCGPMLNMGALKVSGTTQYRDGITYPTPTPPTTGPNCRAPVRFCDAAGNPVATPTQATLNASSTGTCPAIGGSETCGIDPASLGATCVSDADCPTGKVCTIACSTPSCLSTSHKCGAYYASCAGIPAATSVCDPAVYRECPDPQSVGTVTTSQAASQLPPQTTVAPSLIMPADKKLIPLPYVTLQGGFCASPAVAPPSEVSQNNANDANLGNNQWGVFVSPELSGLMSFSWKELKEQSFQVGARVGVAAGGKVMGYSASVVKLTLDVDLQNCGGAIGADLRILGDSVASIDTIAGFQSGTKPLTSDGASFKTAPADQQECLSKFIDRDNKAADLRSLMYSAREARAFYLDKGTSKDLCTRTNAARNLTFNCDDPNIVNDLDIPNVWINEYDQAGRDYGTFKHTLDITLHDKISASGQYGLFSPGHRYNAKFVPDILIPVGPATVTLAIAAFGEWHVRGALQFGVLYDGGLVDALASLTPLTDLVTPDHDIRVLGGPVITPGVTVGVTAFAGIGIPGASLGIEGTLDLLGVSVPLDARLVAARLQEPDTRDLQNSVFTGDAFPGIDNTKVHHWRYGYAVGGKVVLEALSGQIDLALRVRLLFVHKTFRKNLTKWTGLKGVFPILSIAGAIGDGDDPLVGTEEFGVYADRIAHTTVQPLGATDPIIGSPNPNAHYPDVLTGEPCIIVVP